MKKCLRCNKEFFKREGQSNWHWNKQVWCNSNCRSNQLRKGYRYRERNHKWIGGRTMSTQGYIVVNLGGNKKILEHRFVMEKYLGRKLSTKEQIHHINHNKIDNRLENLMLCSPTEHRKQHPPTTDIKRKISFSMKGRTFTEIHRAHLSKAALGNKNGMKIRSTINR